MNARYRHHQYTYSKPWQTPYHRWELVGPDGAIHFTASQTPDYPMSCGLEIHRCAPAEHQMGSAPDHVDCPLTGGRCWHDGTSLYASETLWPRMEGYLARGDHETIFRILEREADERFLPAPNTESTEAMEGEHV